MSTVSADRFAVNKELIRVNGNEYWLYGAADPEMNEIVQLRPFSVATK